MNSNTSGDQKINPTSTVTSEQKLVVSARTRKRKLDPKIIKIAFIAVCVCAVVGVFVALVVSGTLKLGRTPTPGLAKAVCERRDGSLGSREEPFDDFESAFNCMKNKNISEDGINSSGDFQYYSYFLKEDSIETYRNKLKQSVGDSYTALEDSDSYLKYFAETNASPFLNGTAYVIAAIYENNYVMIQAMDYKLAEKILHDLGFPKGEQMKDLSDWTGASDSEGSETSENSDDSESSEKPENTENADEAEGSETRGEAQ